METGSRDQVEGGACWDFTIRSTIQPGPSIVAYGDRPTTFQWATFERQSSEHGRAHIECDG